ncbi:MAG: amidohydrolase, partial [Bacteroidetes bacterium]|nr:amidohydrolase [Bacteroidota bacterium]
MKRRDLIKGIAAVPLIGAFNPFASVLASNSGKNFKKRLVIDTH